MIRVDCEQGSPEWLELRRGIVTASHFKEILTPTGKLSAQARAYRYKLLAEWLSGEVEDQYLGPQMERGWMLEPNAVKWYEFRTGETVDRVGFVFRDPSRLVGCSPDGLVGEDGGIEIKCPDGKRQVEFLLTKRVPQEHQPQIQGNLWVTGREWWDYVSYHPDLPSETVRIEPDKKYMQAIDDAVNTFTGDLMADRIALMNLGYEPAEVVNAMG